MKFEYKESYTVKEIKEWTRLFNEHAKDCKKLDMPDKYTHSHGYILALFAVSYGLVKVEKLRK